MHKMLVIKIYFPLDVLHISNYISPSSGANFISCTLQSVYADTSGCCVVIATQQPDVWYRHIQKLIGLYSYCKMMHGAYNVKFVTSH